MPLMGQAHARTLTVLLNVRDAQASASFYRTLGFAIAARYPEGANEPLAWARLTAGDMQLMLNTSEAIARRPLRSDTESYDDVVLHVGVDDAASARAMLIAAGAQPGEIEAQMYGVDEFTVRDPDGYELAITSPRSDA